MRNLLTIDLSSKLAIAATTLYKEEIFYYLSLFTDCLSRDFKEAANYQ